MQKRKRFLWVLLFVLTFALMAGVSGAAWAGEVTITAGADGVITESLVKAAIESAAPEFGYTVKITDSATAIGDNAFSEYAGLTGITIPDSVTSIGEGAFFSCSSLTSITIPDSVSSIGDTAFQFCSSLTNITIPDGVTSIGGGMFAGCTDLTKITLPDSVTSIGNSAFYLCSDLTNITIPDGVTRIDNYAFSECTSLTNITLPDSVTSIGDGAFYGCNLTKITLPDGVSSIGDSVFEECHGLTDVTLPDGVTSIGGGAFYGCTGLTDISIPSSVTSIGNSAFCGCTSLTEITIPEGVTSIGEDTFLGCTRLTKITLPDGVTSIGGGAFYGCTGLTDITIPQGVTSIGEYVFRDCTSLTNITLPEGITGIGDGAFASCESLTAITIPEGVTNIGSYMFFNCQSLTEIIIPKGVTSIGNEAFNYCYELESVKILAAKPPVLGTDAFANTDAGLQIQVPDASLEAYKGSRGWSEIAGKIIAIPETDPAPGDDNTTPMEIRVTIGGEEIKAQKQPDGSYLLAVPVGTDITKFAVTFVLPKGATVSPDNGSQQDFSKGPVTYTITAQDGKTQEKIVVVVKTEQVTATGKPMITPGLLTCEAIYTTNEDGSVSVNVRLPLAKGADPAQVEAMRATLIDITPTSPLSFAWVSANGTVNPITAGSKSAAAVTPPYLQISFGATSVGDLQEGALRKLEYWFADDETTYTQTLFLPFAGMTVSDGTSASSPGGGGSGGGGCNAGFAVWLPLLGACAFLKKR